LSGMRKRSRKAKGQCLDRREVRAYFYQLLDYLDLPRIPLYVRGETISSDSALGIFNLNKNKEPYVVVWRDGWKKSVIQHEIIHYFQFLIYGDNLFHVHALPECPFELEAESLEILSKSRLKKYFKYCRLILDLKKGKTYVSIDS